MWTNRGSKDMVAYWANMYGWQDDALNQQQSVPINEMVLGLDCLFPPPDPNLPPPVHAPPPAPTDLEVEINRILAERNALDDKLCQYVIQLTILGWHERCRYITRRLKYV